MLEVRRTTQGFVVFDTIRFVPIMHFRHKAAADAFVAERAAADPGLPRAPDVPERVPLGY